MIEFRLPDVGEGIDAAEVIEWHVAAGAEVTEDQPLVDIQTDKAIVAIPCPTTGTVAELRAEVGETVPVGDVIAVFAPAGDGAAAAAEPAADEPAAATAPAAAAEPAPAAAAAQPAPPSDAAAAPRPLASPAVRKLAREAGIDLRALMPGSGPGGRIVREDLRAAGDDGPSRDGAPARAAAPAPARPRDADEVLPLKGARRAIARTLTEAWQTVPTVIDYREVDATALIAARKRLKAAALAAGDDALAGSLTVIPLLVKMCATALGRHPYVNGSIDLERDEIVLHAAVNVGIATAAPDGLIVPVVPDADRKSVHEIAREVAELSVAARERRVTREQLLGGTFTVNNYGALGIWLGTPIVVPPQVANFGVGRMEERAVVRDGEIVIRPIIPVACSGDHRLLDGDTLAAFVSDVVALMEDPALLLGELR
jgi:pyruvate dehydrogenase E2 component (dihydrolipoamide acetyltransferase)